MSWLHQPSRTPPSVPTQRLGTELAVFSSTGPVRSSNEDCVRARHARRIGGGDDHLVIVALADGMGGHVGGAVASETAVAAALESFTSGSCSADVPSRLAAALCAAHEAVHTAACADEALAGMGTTLLLFVPGDGAGAHVAWVGDSRLYRWRAGRVEQITRDDTLVMDLLDAGLLTPEQLAGHPERSVLTQALGTQRSSPRWHLIGPLDEQAEDRYLLSTDGVHDVLSAEVLAELLALPSAAAASQALRGRALAAGSEDNLSAAVVRLVAAPERRAAVTPTVNTRHDLTVWPGDFHDPQ